MIFLSPRNVADNKHGHDIEDNSGQVQLAVTSSAASTVNGKSKSSEFRIFR